MTTEVKIIGLETCSTCHELEIAIRRVVIERGLDVAIEKIGDYDEIMRWDVLVTPALAVNGKVVSTGRIPADDEIVRLLEA